MSKREQRLGNAGQDIAESALRARGVLLVEKIGTPVRLIPHPQLREYYRVLFESKVSGDHRGVLPDGCSVLAETKTIIDRNLRYSDLREHQPERLSRHAEYGLSLLVWVHGTGVYVLAWPVPGFHKGTSITVEKAMALDMKDIEAGL